MRDSSDIEHAIDAHGDAVWRACSLYFGSKPDAQDAFQETMLRYATSSTPFESEDHRKAWLIRVASNVCKDMLKAAHRKNVAIDDVPQALAAASSDPATNPDSRIREALAAIRALPDPPRTPVYLAIYEGYTAPEIADMVDAPVNTVYSWIARGKKQLKEALA